MLDASNVLNASNIDLERNAETVFGAAVDDFGRGDANMGRAPTDDFSTPKGPRNERAFYATSYAAALSGATGFRPKLKFLFKVEFFFTEEAKRLLSQLNGGSGTLDDNDFTFLIKSVDRPKVDMEYEDDVNMYNFRTKVLKKIRHRELTMTFLDDTGNRVFDFFDRMMMLHSPITRRSKTRVSPFDKPAPFMNDETGNGMVFSDTTDGQEGDLSHRGVINSPVGNAIESIRIKQIFVDSSEQDLTKALKQNCFDFINPRIVSFDLDDLNHETSEASQLTLQFDYDWLELVSMTITDQQQLTPSYSHIVNPFAVGAPTDLSPSTDSGNSSNYGSNDDYAGLKNNATAPIYMSPTPQVDYEGAGQGRFTSANGTPFGYEGLIAGARADTANGLLSFVKNSAAQGLGSILNDSTIVAPVAVDAFVKSKDVFSWIKKF